MKSSRKNVSLRPLERQVEQKKRLIEGYKADLGKLVIKGSDAQLRRHEQLQGAAQTLRKKIDGYKGQRSRFRGFAR